MRWITRIEGGPKRVNHAAVTVGHKIYTFGGYCTGESAREYTSIDVHVLNTTTYRWTKHPVSNFPYLENDDILPYKRYGHTAVVYQNKIYIWGGRNHQASCGVLFCFDTLYHCWTAPKTTGDIPPARDGHTACVWKHFMYIFGGFEEASTSFARCVYVLNFETMQWRYLHTCGTEPSVRDFHSAICLYDRMYIFGGRGTNSLHSQFIVGSEIYSNKVWYLDLHTQTWYNPKTSGQRPIGRRSHSAFVYNNKMYIFGGYNAIQLKHYRDIYEYDPLTSVWKLMKTKGKGPCNRRRQACVIVKDKMFMFGGTSPILNSVGQPDANGEENLTDHSDMYVLDFQLTLKTLCKVAVNDYDLDVSSLPHTLREEVDNMFLPNKITMVRHSNSAG